MKANEWLGEGVNRRMDKISIIVPCYNEEAALPYFFSEIRKVADRMSATKNLCFELLFINDGSRDRTQELLREFTAEDDRVRYISFSRNFGKEAAMYAGFRHATGDFAVLMDAAVFLLAYQQNIQGGIRGWCLRFPDAVQTGSGRTAGG